MRETFEKTLQDLGAVETGRARQREEAETGSQRFSGLPPTAGPGVRGGSRQRLILRRLDRNKQPHCLRANLEWVVR